ncbi:hypothetical protein [Jiangella endophytica]|uniref:hypothetical protein n=1 Tax=Jiangella endophytica TaxID=1623398 RepID=UPI000E34B886|nr:hypothetical protein [Jiangella endophytica]
MATSASSVRAARSSIELASNPRLHGVTATYFSGRARPAAWPVTTLDPVNQRAVWALCAELSGHSAH